MTESQASWLAALICVAVAVIPSVMSVITFGSKKSKEKAQKDEQLESRFDSVEKTMRDLTAAITLLNQQITQMTKAVEKSEAHEESLDKRVSEHDIKLTNHEARLSNLEDK